MLHRIVTGIASNFRVALSRELRSADFDPRLLALAAIDRECDATLRDHELTALAATRTIHELADRAARDAEADGEVARAAELRARGVEHLGELRHALVTACATVDRIRLAGKVSLDGTYVRTATDRTRAQLGATAQRMIGRQLAVQ